MRIVVAAEARKGIGKPISVLRCIELGRREVEGEFEEEKWQWTVVR